MHVALVEFAETIKIQLHFCIFESILIFLQKREKARECLLPSSSLSVENTIIHKCCVLSSLDHYCIRVVQVLHHHPLEVSYLFHASYLGEVLASTLGHRG